MEQRKLIKLGNSSFAIALPIDWVKKAGLKKGENVFLEQNGNGEITVSSKFKKINGDKEIKIEINDKNDDDLRRKFTSAYISGNSIFNFIGNNAKEKSKTIKKIIADYLSCEVVEETEENVKVKDFFDFEEINIDGFVKRIDNNIREMFRIVIGCLEKGSATKKEVDEVEQIDWDINRFYFLNSRVLTLALNNPSLATKLKIASIELFNNWWLSFHLEHAGDYIKNVCGKMKNSEITEQNKKILNPILEKIKMKYENSLKAFYNKDFEKALEVMEEGKKINHLCEGLLGTKDSFLSLMGENLKEINNASYQIAKMIANMKE